jgi:putative ABC transport system permease protein
MENQFAVVSAPMAGALQNDFPQVSSTTRFRNLGSMLLHKNGTNVNVKELHTTYVDSTLFSMLGLHLIYGDPKTALTKPNTLVLTRTAAEKHFELDNAVGQTLTINNNEVYTVTGVMEDLPKNSFLRDHRVFLAMAGNADAAVADWGSNNYYTLVKLAPNADVPAFLSSLDSMLGTYIIPWAQVYFPGITLEQFKASGNYFNLGAIKLPDIHLYSHWDDELSANSDIQNVYILFFIALFLIVLASVNFMNLSTAYSLKRAKEVGIRKTLGSNKSELIRQFLMESGLVSFISLMFALVLAVVLLPLFNELAAKDISIPFANPLFWGILLLATVLLSLFSGSYPAFFMSKFIPVQVLKGLGKDSVGSGRVRNSLVIFQFAISVFLIVSTIVIFQQLRYIQHKELGFSKDHVLVVEDMNMVSNGGQAFKEEVERLSQVRNATLSSYFPTPSSRSNSSFFREGMLDQEDVINMQNWGVDYDYIKTLDLEIIAGRDFDRQYATDSTAIILNESALKVLGLTPEEALDIRIVDNFSPDADPRMLNVIGVVKDFHFESLRRDISSLSLVLGQNAYAIAIKVGGEDLTETVSAIESAWNKVAPGQPFNYYFMEDSFNNTYQAEQQLGRIFMTFTILSIVIACLGLFGLAAFNAEKRTKEIGIRKVMGASVSQIAYKLSIDFLKLVAISILFSLPLGWFAMNKWLEDFSYKIEIGWWVFVLAAVLAVAISVATVSYQGIKAAIVNPVKSLRAE